MRRPKNVVDQIRIKAWFAAVKQQSGFESTYSLGKHFSTTGKYAFRKNKESFHPSKWNKYERGEDAPKSDLITRVENEFKGTARWIDLPLWDVIRDTPPSCIQIRDAIGRARPNLAKYILDETGSINKSEAISKKLLAPHSIDSLSRQCDLDTLAALCGLMRYAELHRNNFLYVESVVACMPVLLIQCMICQPLNTIKHELFLYLLENYFNTTPDQEIHLYPNTMDLETISDKTSWVINRARDLCLIDNTDREIGRLIYWMEREGLFKLQNGTVDPLTSTDAINIIQQRMSSSDKDNPVRELGALAKMFLLSYRARKDLYKPTE